MATIKEQDIVLVSKESDGTKVIQMPITRVENVEGGIATVNGIKPDSSKNVTITKVDQATSANRAIDADKAVKATQDGNGRIIANTYATKDELVTKLDVDSAFTKTTADSLYLGKTDTAVAATKALQDNLGNNISDTYATKAALSSGLLPLATKEEIKAFAKESEVLKHTNQSLSSTQIDQVLTNLGVYSALATLIKEYGGSVPS